MAGTLIGPSLLRRRGFGFRVALGGIERALEAGLQVLREGGVAERAGRYGARGEIRILSL